MKLSAILPALALLSTPVFADELLTSAQITAAIAGNTVQGGMSDGAVYSEFYDADGTIKAEGYSGTWSVESDEMCFDYGEGPTCLALQIAGDQVTWIADGEKAGTGEIVSGNPNAY